jgi:hypothetical protein
MKSYPRGFWEDGEGKYSVDINENFVLKFELWKKIGIFQNT